MKFFRMESLFVPYEIALALKELGFDEPCFARYYNSEPYNIQFFQPNYAKNFNEKQLLHNKEIVLYYSAPTFSQAFRFFREKYNLFYGISVFNAKFVEESGLCHPFMAAICNKSESLFYEGYEIYEEAELECLKKLIEIVKNDIQNPI